MAITDKYEVKRRPQETWREFVHRLENENLRARAEAKEVEAKALQEVAEATGDVHTESSDGTGNQVDGTKHELEVTAQAKLAAAQTFRKALGNIDGGGADGRR